MRNKVEKNSLKASRGIASTPRDDTPPGIREKLAEAARGSFSPGDRSNISKIKSTLK
jgi:hypothetical protein